MSPPGVFAATLLVALLGGVVPFVSLEAYLLAVSAFAPGADGLALALAASLGQMGAKSLLYAGGRGLLRVPLGRSDGRIRRAVARLARSERGASSAVVLLSAVVGLPPFYAMSIAAGTLRTPFGRFFALGGGGCLLRYVAVVSCPRLFV